MSKFRKKPVVIEARQYDGSWESAKPILDWIEDEKPLDQSGPTWSEGSRQLTIYTLEGPMRADADDWIIRGVKGEFYPCKPDIFAATYEAAETGLASISMRITGPNSDGEYWLHLRDQSRNAAGFNLGNPAGMIGSALLRAVAGAPAP